MFRNYTIRGCMLFVALCGVACGAEPDRIPEYQATTLAEFNVPNARQGVAVDDSHFYAANNYAISKHDKLTGELVARWEGESEGNPLIHLDSLSERGGRLYASHSNYPGWPMTSSAEVWATADLEHVDTHSFGVYRGSLTWLDWHDGHWWGAFANYDKIQTGHDQPYGHTDRTQIVKFDENFVVVESWTLPEAILDRMRPMSNSGGSWGPDGYLYLTGHDHGEAYVMELPQAGSVLHWAATVIVPTMEGQGIAWDRSTDERVLWAIYKKDRKVLKVAMPKISATKPQ